MAADSNMQVLVVDDNRTMLRIIRSLLSKLGFLQVDEALDGAAALEKMRDKRYGLVIADWNMETMSGYELLRQVRADAGLKQIPFIIMTAEANCENVIAARKAHVDNFIVKPFNAATLKGKIDEACAGGARALMP
jgi:two-component system, chemotaxis family, chemotaxis protein CheY